MTQNQLQYICSINNKIEDINRILENPGEVRFVSKGERGYYFDIFGIVANSEMNIIVKPILEKAREEIISVLKNELTRLEAEFSKIDIKIPLIISDNGLDQ